MYILYNILICNQFYLVYYVQVMKVLMMNLDKSGYWDLIYWSKSENMYITLVEEVDLSYLFFVNILKYWFHTWAY